MNDDEGEARKGVDEAEEVDETEEVHEAKMRGGWWMKNRRYVSMDVMDVKDG